MPTLDPALVSTAPRVPFADGGFRHQPPGYDPRSGEGARKRGGRFNPPESFPVLYLCTTRPCAIAELDRLGERQSLSIDDLLPRVLFRYEVRLGSILDLTKTRVLNHLGITDRDLTQAAWSFTQELGEVSHDLGLQGLLAPSATGVDSVLAVFVDHIGLGAAEPRQVETWESVDRL